MMNNVKIYKCPVCGKVVTVLSEGGGQLVCCGKPMVELQANTTEAATEKHLPVVTVNGNQVHVKVGSVPHPMLEEHFIQWVLLETNLGMQIKQLKAAQQPEANFSLSEGEQVLMVYEYCNLHGLWATKL